MRQTIRATAIALSLMLLLSVVAVAEGGRLHDQAGLLTPDEAVELSTTLDSCSDSTDLYVGMVTLPTIGNAAIKDYAYEYYHETLMAGVEPQDGIVAFVAMESRDFYIYTYGNRATSLYDDVRIEAMLDVVTPLLSEQEYMTAFSQFVTEVSGFHREGVKADQYTYDTDTGERYDGYREPEPLIEPTWVLASFGIALGVAALACAGVVGKYKLIFVPDSYPFRDKGRLELTRREDIFLRKHVTSRVIQQNNGGSSGGGGGSRSSVSRSSGGGGRKF